MKIKYFVSVVILCFLFAHPVFADEVESINIRGDSYGYSDIVSEIPVAYFVYDFEFPITAKEELWYCISLADYGLPEVVWVHSASIVGNRNLITSYDTKYSSGTTNRNHNIEYASQQISVEVPAATTFSFNAIANSKADDWPHYKTATILVNGKKSTGIGGGICQVSSTLYNAVKDIDGIKILERHSHSAAVDYVPRGLDATVSLGTLDFRFSNNRETPIYIEAIANSATGILTIEIYE